MIQYGPGHPDMNFVQITKQFGPHDTTIGGRVMTRSLEAEEVLRCIEIAKRRGIKDLLLIHSDRGVQYTSKEYKKRTEEMI